MPKSSKTPASKQPFYKKLVVTKKAKTIAITALAILTLIVGFNIYQHNTKLNRAEEDIRILKQDLAEQGIDTTLSKGCGKDQAKFDAGLRRCNVGIEGEIKNGRKDLVSIEQGIQNYIHKNFTPQRDNQTLKYNNSIMRSYSHNATGLSCISWLEFHEQSNSSVEFVEFIFSCTQPK